MPEATEGSGSYQPFPAFPVWTQEVAGSAVLGVADRFFDLLARARAEYDEADVERAIRELSRAAAVDTNAIEGLFPTDRGFTRTVATESAAWQVAATERGEHVLALIESSVEAYEFVLDAATQREPITEAWIRQLHEVLCRAQPTYRVHTATGFREQTLPTGQYKSLPNSPTSLSTGRTHHYASPADTPGEMARLVGELRSPEFAAAHPVLQAAWAHYAFVCVHPFADGNGRVARALASVFTYRAPGVPLVVYADQRDGYIDGLEAADAGDPSAFVDFIAQRVIDVVELVRINASLPSTPDVSTSLAAIQAGAVGLDGLSHDTVDALAKRLSTLIADEMSATLRRLALPAGVSVNVGTVQSVGRKAPPGYRAWHEGMRVRMSISQDPPANVRAAWTCAVHVSLPGREQADFLVESNLGDLDVYVRDIHPAETHLLGLKLQSFVTRLTDALFAELARAGEASLRQKGYLA